jgi:tRNA1Val (adenine37-N6)-methyltransferase
MKNTHYTYDYFQPEEYKFSLDSVFFAQKIAKLIESTPDINNWKALDLCAGCGIIGFELSHHTQHQMKIDFLEVQSVYQSFFDKNKKMIYPEDTNDQFSFLNINYNQLLDKKFENTYDLIVCNPPYFFKEEGLLSPNDFKNRCRFFIDSDFETLIQAIVFSLKPNAKAYVLIRSGAHHGRSPIEAITRILGDNGTADIIDHVRGTDIIMISKN